MRQPTPHTRDKGSGPMALALLGLLALLSPPVRAAEPIPNFIQNPTIQSAKSGPWSDPATWSPARLPTAADVVVIFPATTVMVDTASAVAKVVGILPGIRAVAGGTLRFRTDVNTHLMVGTLLVMEGGTLEVGTPTSPVAATVTAEITIRDIPIDTTIDPSQYGTGLLALGKVTMHGSIKTPTFVRLAAEPRAGDTTLTLVQQVAGWQAGDKLILPDTRQLLWNDWNNFTPQWEELRLASVSPDGKTLTLASPLQFDHLGARNMNGTLDFLPHVGNLTRNVLIRSENPAGTRGHVFLTHRTDADIRYAEFPDLGRTSTLSTNDTTFDASGNVTHIGTNQRGRNPLYLKGVIGSATPAPGQPAFSLIGNSVHNQTTPLPRWGIGLDSGSSNGLLRDNITYRIAGAGIMVTGSGPLPNLIERNFMVRTLDDTSQLPSFGENGYARVLVDNQDPLGYDGTGMFSYQGAGNNSFRDNVAADFGNTGFTFLFGTVMDSSGNEAYGTGSTGYALPGVGQAWGFNPDPQAEESVIRGAKIWHVFGGAVEPWLTNKVTLEDLIIRGDPSRLGNPDNFTSGVAGTLFLARDFTLRGADIQGRRVGFSPGAEAGGGVQTVENSYFNNGTDIFIKPMAHYARDSSWLGPRKTILRNVRFETNPSKQYAILMYVPEDPRGNIIQKDEVLAYDYNGVAGNNFQVFYQEQSADYILPQADPERRTGSPEVGLTNAQNWAKYVYVKNPSTGVYEVRLRQPTDPPEVGLSFAGAGAPCGGVGQPPCSQLAADAASKGIHGLLHPIPPEDTPYPKGDANLSRSVTLHDAVHVIDIILGRRETPAPGTRAHCAADADDNGGIGIADVLAIVNHLIGRKTLTGNCS